jgi:hypothetical protein
MLATAWARRDGRWRIFAADGTAGTADATLDG